MKAVLAEDLAAQLKRYRLSSAEYEKVCGILGRAPRGVEWALFSALWSEHCSYKSSKIHLRKLFNKSPYVLDAEGENAGVIDLGEGERIAFKMESHNHPSFIEPYQGAATGVGGILRDIFTMGARPIASADYLCFGDPQAPRMERLVDGVVRGIGGYGNAVGVPTITGQTEFHESYSKNILVNAMSVGLFRPGEKVFSARASGPGNWVVYVGAKTGRDGVHGAAMASESFGEDSAHKRPTVQIGDPFYEKLLIEACLEVMAEDLAVAVQDMGAAGLTSSSFEMSAKGGVGFHMDLKKVPLRDSTLSPEDILLSESQERMLMVVEPNRYPKVREIFSRWGLDAAVIGEVLATPKMRLTWGDELLCEIDPSVLTDEAPRYERAYSEHRTRLSREPSPKGKGGAISVHGLFAQASVARDPHGLLLAMAADSRFASRDFIVRQYDGHVGAATARDARSPVGVLRLRDSGRALSIALGCRPSLMRIDTRMGAQDAIFYPALSMAALGFEPLAATDCLNFANPEKSEVMSDFVASVEGLSEAARAAVIPIISGNVSFYNETEGTSITSTPATGVVGLRPHVDFLPESEFREAGLRVFVLSLPQVVVGGTLTEGAHPFCPLSDEGKAGRGTLGPDIIARFIKELTNLGREPSTHAVRVAGRGGLLWTLARMSMGGTGLVVQTEGYLKLRGDDTSGPAWTCEVLYEVVVATRLTEAQLRAVVPSAEIIDIGLTGGASLSGPGLSSMDVSQLRSEWSKGWGRNFESLA